jgi:hypothetical protein
MRYKKALNAELLEVINTKIYFKIWKDIENTRKINLFNIPTTTAIFTL